MNISKEQPTDLTALIKIQLEPEDYRPKVQEVIKKYKHTAQIPGFRPGKVPAGIIKKMYGKTVLIEELNHLISDSLHKYIQENGLDMIGTPLPIKSENASLYEDGQSFEFEFEVALAPKVEVNLSSLDAIPYYLVKIDEKMVEDDINEMRRRYGKFSNPEAAEMNHILYGEFEELDENGNVKEGGNKTTTTLALELIKEEDYLKPFIGLKKDESVTFNPMKVLNEKEAGLMLKVEKDSPAIHSDYKFNVKTINQIDKAELNQEFFDKIYGEGTAKDEKEFRIKIREGIASYFERESDKKLKKDLRVKLLSELEIPLPDDFLKRMIKAEAEKPIEDHEFEHQYYHLAEDLRWDLIRSHIAEKNNITATEEEVKNTARVMVREQFIQYGYYDVEPSKIEEAAKKYLEDGDMAKRIYRAILEDKVFTWLKSQVTLNMIELPYSEFVTKLGEKTEHELEHHHEH